MLDYVINDRKVSCYLSIEITPECGNDHIWFQIFKKDLDILSFHIVVMELMIVFEKVILGMVGAMGIKIGA